MRDIEIVEIRESRAQDTERRRIEESIAIANVIPERAMIVVLDQRGENLDSAALAALLREWRAEDRPAACFVIGGADGWPEPARPGQAQARLRDRHLAASAGARHAAWSSSIAPAPFWPAIPITEAERVRPFNLLFNLLTEL